MQVTRVFCDKCGEEIPKGSYKLASSRYSEQFRGQWRAEDEKLRSADFCEKCIQKIIRYAFQKEANKEEAAGFPLSDDKQEIEWSAAIEKLRANQSMR